jgi:hypothetical protein
MLISLAGVIGAVMAWFLVPSSLGILRAIAGAGGFGLGLILGVVLARRTP